MKGRSPEDRGSRSSGTGRFMIAIVFLVIGGCMAAGFPVTVEILCESSYCFDGVFWLSMNFVQKVGLDQLKSVSKMCLGQLYVQNAS